MKKICSILFICACLLGGLHVPIKAALFENDKTYDLKVNLVKKVDGLWVPSGGADMIYKDAKAEVKNDVITFKIAFKKEYGTQFNIHTGNANAPVANLLIREAEDKIVVSFTQTMQDYVKEGKYGIGNKYQTMLFDFTTLKEEGKQVEDKLPYEKNKDYFVPIVLEAENSRLHFFKNNTKLSIDDKYQATITLLFDETTKDVEFDGKHLELTNQDGRKLASFPLDYKSDGLYEITLNNVKTKATFGWNAMKAYAALNIPKLEVGQSYQMHTGFLTYEESAENDNRINDYLISSKVQLRDGKYHMTQLYDFDGKTNSKFVVKNGTNVVEVKRSNIENKTMIEFDLPYIDRQYNVEVVLDHSPFPYDANVLVLEWDSLIKDGTIVPDTFDFGKNKKYSVGVHMMNYDKPDHYSMADQYLNKKAYIETDEQGKISFTYSINDGQTLANVVMYVDREMNHALPTTLNDKNNQVTTILPAYDKKGILYGEATIVSVGLHQKYVIAIDYTLLKSLGGNEQKDDILEDTTDNIKKNTYIMFDLGKNGTSTNNLTILLKNNEHIKLSDIPHVQGKNSYVFKGWKDEQGTIYSNEMLSKLEFTKHTKFTAVYENKNAQLSEGNNPGVATKNASLKTKSPSIKNTVQTGDTSSMMVYLLASIFTFGIVAVVFVKKYKLHK